MMMKYSILLPVLNEEENLLVLFVMLEEVFEKMYGKKLREI